MAPGLTRSILPMIAEGSFFGDFLHAYTPRRLCMNSEPAVIWLSALSDGLIALSYFSIPLALVLFVRRRRDLSFNWMFLLFASFIFACGATHVMGIWAIWQPLYKLDGTIKLATGLLSAGTAALLWRLIPTLLRLPSPSDLALANSNLSQLRDELEQRVELRTRQLAEAGERERAAREAAVRANRAKDEFLATLSHELRTPLHSIVGWAEVMSQPGIDVQERERAVSVIRRNATIQAQLIEDMLDLSRVTSGKLRLDVRDIDLKSVIEAALETIEPAASAKGIHISALALMTTPCRGDPDRLQQAVWNLLSNAVKFTPPGGQVTVELECEDSEIVLDVSDTGPGLEPEVQPFVFDRFRQGDSSATRKHGGLGLGLAIVRHIVELHGGTVQAGQATGGSGAMFSIRLPQRVHLSDAEPTRDLEDVEARSSADRSLPSAALLEDVHVLVVDDESDSRALARTALERYGAAVTTASSAAEARAALDGGGFDALVSDIGMPGEDGLSLLRTIRQRPAADGGAIPALALTAFARAEDRQAAIDAGFQEYISKPVELTELVLTVATLVGRNRDRTG